MLSEINNYAEKVDENILEDEIANLLFGVNSPPKLSSNEVDGILNDFCNQTTPMTTEEMDSFINDFLQENAGEISSMTPENNEDEEDKEVIHFIHFSHCDKVNLITIYLVIYYC